MPFVCLIAGCVVAVALAVGAGPAAAALATVHCPPYGGDSLHAKISAGTPGDTLLIRGTCTGNFTVSKNLTLQGASTAATLDGGGAGTTLTISSGAIVTVRALTITGGAKIGDGGGINLDVGALNLVNSLVTGNS